MTDSDRTVRHGGAPDSGISRRALLGAATILVGLAGCSGDDGGGGGTSPTGESGPTATPANGGGGTGQEPATTTASSASMTIGSRCQVKTTPSGLAVVGCQSEADQGALMVTTTVRNEGQETASFNDFRLKIEAYDAAEAILENNITANASTSYPAGRDIGPGETGVAETRLGLEGSHTPADVKVYTITMY